MAKLFSTPNHLFEHDQNTLSLIIFSLGIKLSVARPKVFERVRNLAYSRRGINERWYWHENTDALCAYLISNGAKHPAVLSIYISSNSVQPIHILAFVAHLIWYKISRLRDAGSFFWCKPAAVVTDWLEKAGSRMLGFLRRMQLTGFSAALCSPYDRLLPEERKIIWIFTGMIRLRRRWSSTLYVKIRYCSMEAKAISLRFQYCVFTILICILPEKIMLWTWWI